MSSEHFDLGTVASFWCYTGFSLNGTVSRLNCTDDDDADTIGTWSGTEPSCLGKYISVVKKINY